MPLDLAAIPIVDNHCHSLLREQPRRRRRVPDPPDRDVLPGDRPGRRPAHAALPLDDPRAGRAARTASRRPTPSTPRGGSAGVECAGARGRRARQLQDLADRHGLRRRHDLLARRAAGPRPVPDRGDPAARADDRAADPRVGGLRRRSSTRTGPRSSDLRGRGIVGLKSVIAYRTGLHVDARRPRGRRRRRSPTSTSARGGDGRIRIESKPLLDHLIVHRRRGGRPPGASRSSSTRASATRTSTSRWSTRPRCASCSPTGSGPPRSCCSTPATRTSGRSPTSPRCSPTCTPTWARRSCSRPARRPRSPASCSGLAPASKILFSTDASLVPELYWVGARLGRRALGRVLDEHIADGRDRRADRARLGRADPVAQLGARLRALIGRRRRRRRRGGSRAGATSAGSNSRSSGTSRWPSKPVAPDGDHDDEDHGEDDRAQAVEQRRVLDPPQRLAQADDQRSRPRIEPLTEPIPPMTSIVITRNVRSK